MSELLKKKKNSFLACPEDIQAAYDYCEGYKVFLDKSKIERFCVEEAVRIAKDAGFVAFEYGKKYVPGDKIYYVQHGRAVIFAIIGSQPVTDGFNITAAHVDCPRLDLKQVPLYEDSGIALMKTHYYGGIRKYQWVTLPLALCGTVCKRNGETIRIDIGNDPADPGRYSDRHRRAVQLPRIYPAGENTGKPVRHAAERMLCRARCQAAWP